MNQGKAYRSKEDCVKQVLKDAKIEFGYHEISAYSIEQMCYAAIGLYESEKDRQEGWTDEEYNTAISKAVEQAYQEGFYAGQGLK